MKNVIKWSVLACVGITLLAIVLVMAGCKQREIVSKQPIDVRYTPAYEGLETTYEHKYSWVSGDWVLMPDTHTAYHHAEYEVLYLLSYDNGTSEEKWEYVNEVAYTRVRKELLGEE